MSAVPLKGFDWSTSTPDLGELRRAGASFAFRYIGLGSADKHLTAPEMARLRSAGFAVGLFCEGLADGMLGGRAAGVLAAEASRDACLALGLDWPQTVYYTADWDVQADQIGYVGAYLTGATSVHGIGTVGLYGPGEVVENVLAIGWCDYGCVAAGWRHNWQLDRAHLVQGQEVTIGGADVDPLYAYRTDIGTLPAPVPAITERDDTMQIVARTGDYATVLTDGRTRWTVHDNAAVRAYEAAGFGYHIISVENFATLMDLTVDGDAAQTPRPIVAAEVTAPDPDRTGGS